MQITRKINKKDYQATIELLDPIYNNNKNELDFAYLLIRAYMKNKNYQEAAIVCMKVLSRTELDTNLLFKASYCFRMSGDFEQAIELSERVKLRKPDEIRNLFHLAEMYIELNNHNRAIKIINKILSKYPNNTFALKLKEKIK